MAATTTLLGLLTPTQGTLSGTWGDSVNYGISDYVDISVSGTLTLTNDGAVTLANTTGSSAGNSITSTLTGAGTVTAQFAIVKVTGTLTVAKVVTGPSYSKTYTVVNSATGGIVTFKASGQTGVSIAVGESAFVYFNGTDYVKVVGTATAGAAGGSTTQVQYNNAGVLAGITGATTNGTALTLVAPVLGTPASATLTNATGLPISTGVSGLGTGVATFLATPSSANLAAALTDETGTGSAVFATSPTLVTPVLGVATGTSFQGIIGNVTPAAGAFTTGTFSGAVTLGAVSSFGTSLIHTIGGHSFVQGDANATYLYGGAGIGISFRKSDNSSELVVFQDSLATFTSPAQFGAAATFHAAITLNAVSSFGTGLLHTIGGHRFVQGDATKTYLYGGTGGIDFRNSANTSGLAIITDAGDVGIGTSSPVSKLDVSGQVTATGGIFKANGAPSLSAATAGEAILAPEGTYGALLYGRGSSYDVVIGQRSTGVALAVVAATNNIYTGGNIGLTTTPTTSGTGITFPATQSASSDANTLDDYEEGFFTATTIPSTAGTITLNSGIDKLAYTKIGRVVYVQGLLEISSVSSPVGAVVYIQGLPFTTADLDEYAGRGGTAFMVNSIVTGINIFEGQTQVEANINASTLGSGNQFYVSFNYIAA